MQSVKTKKIGNIKLADGRVLASPEAIHVGAVDYFEDFLKPKPRSSLPNLSFIVEASIVEEENVIICRIPSLEEVKDSIFAIPIDNSLSPDALERGFIDLVGIL